MENINDTSPVLELKPPTKELEAEAKSIARTVSSFADCDLVNMTLSSGPLHEETILSGQLVQVLLKVSTLLSQGQGVSVLPKHQELTTAQAADLLNVSRPYVVKLLENEKIPHHKAGTHRRIYAEDVVMYKMKIDTERTKVLDKLTEESEKLGVGY